MRIILHIRVELNELNCDFQEPKKSLFGWYFNFIQPSERINGHLKNIGHCAFKISFDKTLNIFFFWTYQLYKIVQKPLYLQFHLFY